MKLNRNNRIPHRCLIKIKGIYPSLKSAEKRAVDSLLSAAQSLPQAGIVEFASRAGCSEATLVRLARKLGYAGFADLKADFAHAEAPVPYRDIDLRDAPEAVIKKIFSNSIQALSDTLDIIDPGQYRRAVEALIGAKRLAFFGLGNAAVVAQDAYQKFLRIGVPCHTAEDPDLQLIIIDSQLARGDVMIAISYTGESRPIIAAARQARRRGVVVLALTNFPLSTLAKQADLVLLTAVFQAHMYGEVASKRLAELCVLESLYVNYLLRKNAQTREILRASNRAVSLNKTANYAGLGEYR